MKDLGKLVPGTIVTVKSITGRRHVRKILERKGIFAGTDLKLLCIQGTGIKVDTGRGIYTLLQEEADAIRYQEQFRRKNDPLLPGGCCAYGNTGDLLDRMEAENNIVYGSGTVPE